MSSHPLVELPRRIVIGVGGALTALLSLSNALVHSGLLDDALRAAGLLAGAAGGRAVVEGLLRQLLRYYEAYGHAAAMVLGATALAATLACLPLLGRALRRRPAVFISFQHTREDAARALEAVLLRAGFRVRRLPFEPGASHQRVLESMQQMQRGADAVVCLPGGAPSTVDAEVYAAAVARQPVIFVVKSRGGSLPDAADKRYPVLSLEVCEQFAWSPVAELLHHVTRDFRSGCALYARALGHSGPVRGLKPVMALLYLALLALAVVGGVHGLAVTHELGGASGLLRAQSVLLAAAVGTFAALCVLGPAAYIGVAIHHLVVQFRAAKRASLHTGEAEFRREEWLPLIPGLAPGEPLYLAMLKEAPLAHHERPPRGARA